eukprot:9318187-Alexandrium_andersonii.AAC.1
MSASLVGSEMCIRDSSRGAPPPGTPEKTHLRRPRRPVSSSPSDSGRNICLLYTSDAADDM